MTEDSVNGLGIYRLQYPVAAFEIVLDTRLSTVTFKTPEVKSNDASPEGIYSKTLFTLRLNRFTNFEADLQNLRSKSSNSDRPNLATLFDYLGQITNSRELPPNQVWRDAFGELAFLLLRYAHKYSGPSMEKAKSLLVWLGATRPKSAWRLSYNSRLSFEHRYRLVKAAASTYKRESGSEHNKNQIDLPELKERELFWWEARHRYELAREWCEGEVYRNPAARQALREEMVNYLHVLKDEPRQQDLKRFLSECGTDIESEVKRILFRSTRPRRQSARSARSRLSRGNRVSQSARRAAPAGIRIARDEVIRRAFSIWFLKRYNWGSALRLTFLAPNRRSLSVMAGLFGLLNVGALLLYVIQIDEPLLKSLGMPSPEGRMALFWGSQVGLQLGSLALLLLFAPVLFRLLMPRALFGSLLAWSTVIFLTLKDLSEITLEPTKTKLIDLCHAGSISDPYTFGYSMLVALGILALGTIFVAYTVTQFTDGCWKILVRTLSMIGFLLFTSLFWALAFALPIKFALERDYFAFDCHCVIPIVVIGSSIAVLFGLMVELIWQDQSLAEPLGEPL